MRSGFAKCKGKNCPYEKLKCRRYTQDASKISQLWMNPRIVDNKCTEFVPNKG